MANWKEKVQTPVNLTCKTAISSRPKLVKMWVFSFSLALFSVTTSANGLERLTMAMSKMVEAAESIQALNGKAQMDKFSRIVSSSDDVDITAAAGVSLELPADLKANFDQAALDVVQQIDDLLSLANNQPKDSSCAQELQSHAADFAPIKAAVHKAASLNLASPHEKMEAFVAINNALPLSIVVGNISMTAMLTCGMHDF